VHTASDLNASTELGSSGAAPPAGEATVMATWGARISYGCANSGLRKLLRLIWR
jgi:hypothetical protein